MAFIKSFGQEYSRARGGWLVAAAEISILPSAGQGMSDGGSCLLRYILSGGLRIGPLFPVTSAVK